MSTRRVIAAEVVTGHPTPRGVDYTAARNAMMRTATADGYNDIARLHHVDTEPWPTVQGTHRHRFEAVAQHAHKQ